MRSIDPRILLSTLWIVLSVNYIFCDVFTLMDSESLRTILSGRMGDLVISREFLLAFAVIMEIPLMMILLSRVLPHTWNRPLNIVAGILLTLIQVWSLTTETPALHYLFFSIVEIGLSAGIAVYAFTWKHPLTT